MITVTFKATPGFNSSNMFEELNPGVALNVTVIILLIFHRQVGDRLYI
jgi:hypothetical protein